MGSMKYWDKSIYFTSFCLFDNHMPHEIHRQYGVASRVTALTLVHIGSVIFPYNMQVLTVCSSLSGAVHTVLCLSVSLMRLVLKAS